MSWVWWLKHWKLQADSSFFKDRALYCVWCPESRIQLSYVVTRNDSECKTRHFKHAILVLWELVKSFKSDIKKCKVNKILFIKLFMCSISICVSWCPSLKLSIIIKIKSTWFFFQFEIFPKILLKQNIVFPSCFSHKLPKLMSIFCWGYTFQSSSTIITWLLIFAKYPYMT